MKKSIDTKQQKRAQFLGQVSEKGDNLHKVCNTAEIKSRQLKRFILFPKINLIYFVRF